MASPIGNWLGLPVIHEGESLPGGLNSTLLSYAANAIAFLPGALLGGIVGWFSIRPVNWVLGWFFRGFNWLFDRATELYGKTVGWCLRTCTKPAPAR